MEKHAVNWHPRQHQGGKGRSPLFIGDTSLFFNFHVTFWGYGGKSPDWGFVSKNAVLSKFGMKLKRHLSKEGSKIGTWLWQLVGHWLNECSSLNMIYMICILYLPALTWDLLVVTKLKNWTKYYFIELSSGTGIPGIFSDFDRDWLQWCNQQHCSTETPCLNDCFVA